MDAHPIPQNVTSFQFKLVGDMTLKQFIYLASGVGIAYLLFVTVSKDYPLVAWPLIIASTLLGISFAFIPIESRPLDYWLGAFLKAIYSPTKRVWVKEGKSYKDEPLFSSRLTMYLAGQPSKMPSNYQLPTIAKPDLIKAQDSKPKTESVSPVPTAQLPSQEQLGKTVNLAKQAQQLQMKIIQTERTLSQIKIEAQKPTQIPVDYSQQVNKILTDLQNLITQASAIKQQLHSVQQPRSKPEPTPVVPLPPKEKVKVVIPVKPKPTQVALTTFPNVINGIVKDKNNNYLDNTVTVIYDKEGLPVRALKTNKLGQFTGSTPLPNGIYTLELEKEGFNFDVLQIELTGQVLPPLIIIAKE